MREFLKIFVMYLGIGCGAGIAGAAYITLIMGPSIQRERSACVVGWKHSALHYKALEKQTPEAIIEYGKLSCEEWFK